jgi:phage-related protein
MSNNSVNFQINVGGNAYEGILKINDAAEKTVGKFDKIAAQAYKMANIGFVFQHIGRTISAVNNTITKYTTAYEQQAVAETKLAAVMRQTIGAGNDEVESIKRLAAEQQKLGVISSDVQVAGAQELATYVGKTNSIKTLLPAINDMVAQQYGLNASQEQYTQIATMVGKVMQGQTGALSRYGYSFTEAQEKVLKFGNEQQRAAVLADVITESVGGVNKALAETPEGKQKQVANNFGAIDARIGSLIMRIKSSFNPAMEKLIEKVNEIIDKIEEKNIISKVTAGIEKLTNFIFDNIKAIGIAAGVWLSYVATMKVVAAYKAVVAFFTKGVGRAIIDKTKAIYKAIPAWWSLITSQGTFLGVSILTVASLHAISKAIKGVGMAIYNIPVIGWILAAVAALIAVFKLLWDKCEGFRRLIFGVWESIKAVFHNIGVVLKAVWENVIKPIFMGIWNIVKKVVVSLWDNIIKPYIMFWVNLYKAVFNTIKTVFLWLWDLVKKVSVGIWEAMKWAFDLIKNAVVAVGEFFAGIWDGIVQGLKAAWDWVSDLISPIINWISELLGNVWGWITQKFSALGAWLYEHLLKPIKDIFTKIGEFCGKILDKIIEKFQKIVGWVKELWNKLFPKDQFKDVGEAYREGAEKGSESFRKSQEEKGDGVGNGTTVNVAELVGGLPTAKGTADNLGGTLDAGGKEVASGGSKPTNIYVNLNKEMVGQITIQAANVTEGAGQMGDIVKRELAQILNSTNRMAS